jgi:hypothetical protein
MIKKTIIKIINNKMMHILFIGRDVHVKNQDVWKDTVNVFHLECHVLQCVNVKVAKTVNPNPTKVKVKKINKIKYNIINKITKFLLIKLIIKCNLLQQTPIHFFKTQTFHNQDKRNLFWKMYPRILIADFMKI